MVVRGDNATRQGGAKLVGYIADQAVEHRGHQRPLLLGQALRRAKEEIGADRGQTITRAAPRRRVHGIRRSGADGPFLCHHSAGLSDFG